MDSPVCGRVHVGTEADSVLAYGHRGWPSRGAIFSDDVHRYEFYTAIPRGSVRAMLSNETGLGKTGE